MVAMTLTWIPINLPWRNERLEVHRLSDEYTAWFGRAYRRDLRPYPGDRLGRRAYTPRARLVPGTRHD